MKFFPGAGSGGGGASGLVPLEQHAASASASLAFTASFTADYDEYMFEFVNVIPVTTNTNLIMRMSTNGGSSYDSGNNYVWTGLRTSVAGSGTAGATPSAKTSSFGLDASGGVSNDANYGLCGTLRVANPLSAALYKRISAGVFDYLDTASAPPQIVIVRLGGAYASTTPVNACQFLMSSGNIASGTIRCYGIAPT